MLCSEEETTNSVVRHQNKTNYEQLYTEDSREVCDNQKEQGHLRQREKALDDDFRANEDETVKLVYRNSISIQLYADGMAGIRGNTNT